MTGSLYALPENPLSCCLLQYASPLSISSSLFLVEKDLVVQTGNTMKATTLQEIVIGGKLTFLSTVYAQSSVTARSASDLKLSTWPSSNGTIRIKAPEVVIEPNSDVQDSHLILKSTVAAGYQYKISGTTAGFFQFEDADSNVRMRIDKSSGVTAVGTGLQDSSKASFAMQGGLQMAPRLTMIDATTSPTTTIFWYPCNLCPASCQTYGTE